MNKGAIYSVLLVAPSERIEFKSVQRARLRKVMGDPPVSALQWRSLESHGWFFAYQRREPPKSDRDGYQRVAKAAKLLLREMNSLDEGCQYFLGLAFSPAVVDLHGRFAEFRNDLEEVMRYAEGRVAWARTRHAVPSNVEGRNRAWENAAAVYEHVTGRTIGSGEAGERRDRNGGRLQPDNEFIRFIAAYTEACGELKPTGDAIRWWTRAHQKALGRPARRRGRPHKR